jgi:NAD(P)-dependent dehydrogenase (short-subunit alcohol dehydrogenase family)
LSGGTLAKRTILLTGSASGIGFAAAEWLRRAGHCVIGADVHDAEIVVDLGTEEGRGRLLDEARSIARGSLDSVIACAGVAHAPPERIVAVNYFGAVATLEGLLPLLDQSERPRAVLVSSSACLHQTDEILVSACLAGDEAAACERARVAGPATYSGSKKALALWMRRTAAEERWGGAGIPLNGIAPGTIRTPMTAPLLASEEGRAVLARATPTVTGGRYGQPDDAAEALAFLATMQSTYVLGQLLFVDGGTDILSRPGTL